MAKTNGTTTEDTSQARNDAYTGMLIVALVALLTGGVLLFLDYTQYPDKDPPKVAKVLPEGALPPGDEPKLDQKEAPPPKGPAKKS